MAARDQLCPAREQEWGGEECWGEAADNSARWRVLLQSGCIEGVELRRWWDRVQGIAREGSKILGEPLDPLLTTSLDGLGGGSVNGTTRGQVVEARDTLKSRLLTRVLQDHRPQKDRHVWAWKQRAGVAKQVNVL